MTIATPETDAGAAPADVRWPTAAVGTLVGAAAATALLVSLCLVWVPPKVPQLQDLRAELPDLTTTALTIARVVQSHTVLLVAACGVGLAAGLWGARSGRAFGTTMAAIGAIIAALALSWIVYVGISLAMLEVAKQLR